MTNRFLLWGAALVLSTVSIASAKSYDVVLTSDAKAGSAQLSAGQYKLKVDGSNAIFTGGSKHQTFTVPVKVENMPTKFSSTALGTVKQGDSLEITTIELGGSTTKLEFSK